MGNKSATLGIKLDTPALVAGSPMSGRVFLFVKKEVDCATLQITFKGQEYSHVHWTTTRTVGSGDNRRTETVHHHAYARRNLVHVDIPLATFPQGKVSPGRYEFPFHTILPKNLPTSMCAHGGGGDCSINYFFRARLHRPGWLKWDVKAKASVLVSAEPVPMKKYPAFVPPSTTRVKFCCCVNKGTMSLGSTVDDTVLARGQNISVGVAAKNDSTVDVKAVRVTVTEIVSWTAAGHWNQSHRCIGKAVIPPEQVAGIQKLASKAKVSPADASNTNRILFNTLNEGKQRTALSIAPNARDTYYGSVIWSKHHLTVKMSTPCCVTNPTNTVIIRVCPQVAMAQSASEPVPVVVAMPVAAKLDKEEKQSLKELP